MTNKEKVQMLVRNGQTIQEIAQETGLSKATVRNYKKEMDISEEFWDEWERVTNDILASAKKNKNSE